MGKKAVLVGCNYPGTKAALRGCVNDVKRMHQCLVERYGFSKDDISLLIDTDRSYVQPTGINIMNAFSNLVNSAKAGDVLYIHYSGHGTRLPAGNGDEDKTGYDECIVPTDMNLITDEDFRNLVNKVPDGCRLTIVSDSCHSGGLIDETKEQIGNSTKPCCFELKSFFPCLCPHTSNGKAIGTSTNKSLPLSTLVNILKQKTGNKDIDIGKLRPSLFEIFGEHASPKVKSFMKNIVTKVHREDVEVALETREESEKQMPPDNGILISGCQTNQFSTDFSPSGDVKDARGALSNVIQMIIVETDGKVTNSELVLRARTLLRRQGFSQRPGLYCSDNSVNANFLC